MKKIGIDARLYYQTGVGVYLRNLLYYLNKINPKNINFIVYILTKDCHKLNKEHKNITFKGVNAKWHTFSEQTSFLFDILKDNLDLMHFTYFSYPVFYPKKYISTIHDTTPLKYKTGKASTKSSIIYNLKHKIFKYVFTTQVRRSALIITPTKSVKKQISQIVSSIPSSKIQPVYEGVTKDYLRVKIKKGSKMFKEEYFLYIGTFYPHKNVDNLIRAYSKVKTDIKLYLVGPDDYFLKRVVLLIKKLNLNNKVIIKRNLTSYKLPELYINATALIHPSLSEGFGLPIIEAAYFGVPIIASKIDVFKEILDGKYVGFDPSDINDIKEKIEFFIRERPKFEYKNLLKKYSFEKMTKKTLELYIDVLKI